MRKLVTLAMLCFCASALLGQSKWYELEKLNPSINSVADEMRPVLTKDGSSMYFTRQGSAQFDHTLLEEGQDLSASLSDQDYLLKLKDIYQQMGDRQITDPILSAFNQDIWYGENIDQDLSLVHHLKAPLNNAFPNSLCAIGLDEQEAIVVNQFPEEGGVKKGFSLIQKGSTGNWQSPMPITIAGLGDIEPDVNLALAEDGRYIILSMERKDSYNHSNDLYICERKGLTKFGQPIHLGPAVNSAYHETAPYLAPDGKTLFFSSNRKGGKGGSDIYFVSRLSNDWNSWSAPRALQTPVNSSAEESHPFFVEATGQLYFSSNRSGNSDIYRVQIAPPNSSSVTLAGVVTMNNSHRPVDAYLVAEPVMGGNFRKVTRTRNGSYKMTLPKGRSYDIEAQGVGYISEKQRVYLNPDYVYFHDYPLDFKLTPSQEGEAIVLENIQFKQSTAILLKNSWPSLEKLASILVTNPKLNILVEGHTDNVGRKQALLQLSNDRAEAIKDYLVLNHSIASDRILTMGRGDLKPLNRNRTEAEKRANRRVEVSVIENVDNFMSNAATSSR